jgi:predicted SAM-dependent methyltransferase
MGGVPSGPWLNVGSGPSNPAGWINFDGSVQARLAGRPWLARMGRRVLGVDVGHWPAGIRHLDIRRGLPYADGSVAVVYASHVLEHLHRNETVRFLAHVRALLEPGGVCRVVVPDVHAIVGWYLAHRQEPASQHTESSSDLLMGMLMLRSRDARAGNRLTRFVRRVADLHEHKWMYDQEGLVAVFEEAGFVGPQPRQYLESVIPREPLAQVERADRLCGGAGVCVEAIKSA